jgi:hypothetical protein
VAEILPNRRKTPINQSLLNTSGPHWGVKWEAEKKNQKNISLD